MNKTVRIVLADDHPIYRDGLRQLLAEDSEFELVHEAGNGREALDQARALEADVLLLDMDMPVMSGLDVAREWQRDRDKSEIIFLTMHRDEDLFNEAIDLGVKGYILKDSAAAEICKAVHTVSEGQPFVSAALTEFMMNRASGARELRGDTPGLDTLTPAERRIMKLIATEMTSKEIADDLGLSLRTIENHRSNICSKLGTRGSNALVKFAYKNQSKL